MSYMPGAITTLNLVALLIANKELGWEAVLPPNQNGTCKIAQPLQGWAIHLIKSSGISSQSTTCMGITHLRGRIRNRFSNKY